MPDAPNTYRAQLGILVPRLADLVYRRGVDLLDGLVVALLVHRGPERGPRPVRPGRSSTPSPPSNAL